MLNYYDGAKLIDAPLTIVIDRVMLDHGVGKDLRIEMLALSPHNKGRPARLGRRWDFKSGIAAERAAAHSLDDTFPRRTAKRR